MNRLVLASALVALTASGTLQQPTFRTSVQTVGVYATVNDGEGHLVPGIDRGQFEILDDGKPTKVTVFSNEPQPITLALMLDVSDSMKERFARVRASSLALVEALQEGDRASIGSYGTEVAISPHLTGDKQVLSRVLHEELWPGGGTPLWRAMGVAMHRLAAEPGRRVVLLLTDGRDTSSRDFPAPNSAGAIGRMAEEEGVMVYAIGMGEGALARNLIRVCERTGGGHFTLDSDAALDATFARVVAELRHQYLLGFEPARLDGRMHGLRVRVKRPGLQVRTRASYVARAER